MNNSSFDAKMRQMAKTNAYTPDTTRLEQTLSSLPARPEHAERTVRRTGYRFAAVFAALLMICATALAARLGLHGFMDINPYNFFEQEFDEVPAFDAQPLVITDNAGLECLRIEAIDSAWLEGRLTFTLHASSAVSGKPLYAGCITDDIVEIYEADLSAPRQETMPLDAYLLVYEDCALYAQENGADAQDTWLQAIAWQTQEDGVTFALQIPDDSFAPTADGSGRIPLRFELCIWDLATGEFHFESLYLSAAAPET